VFHCHCLLCVHIDKLPKQAREPSNFFHVEEEPIVIGETGTTIQAMTFTAQCPPSVLPNAWQAAITDTKGFIRRLGFAVCRLGFIPADLFDIPGGLARAMKGPPVMAMGRRMAQTAAFGGGQASYRLYSQIC
jgi:hypothetical protein